FAKAKPENLIYGHAGLASQPHLGMLAVLKPIAAEGLGVPFTGAGPMAQALLSGTVMAIVETPAVAAASNLPVLAALSEARIAARGAPLRPSLGRTHGGAPPAPGGVRAPRAQTATASPAPGAAADAAHTRPTPRGAGR